MADQLAPLEQGGAVAWWDYMWDRWAVRPAHKMEHQAHAEVFCGWQVTMHEGPDLLCAGDLSEQAPAP